MCVMMCMLSMLMQYTTTGSLWRKVSFSRRMNRASLHGVWLRPQAPSMNRLILLGRLFLYRSLGGPGSSTMFVQLMRMTMVFGRINADALRDVCWRGDLFFVMLKRR